MHSLRALQLLALAALAAAHLRAATYYVNAASPDDSGAGTSWATAKRTIQAAVDLSLGGDTVLVTNGVYNAGTRATPGYTCNNRVVIDKSVLVRSVNGPAFTIIEGSGINAFGTASAVRCVYLSQNAKIEGFTLRHGATLSIINYTYAADMTGGGLYANSQTCEARDCVMQDCYASLGGGAHFGSLYNCTIKNNRATNGGGGAFGCNLYSSVICDNDASFAGGSYYGTRINCTIINNRATAGAGGVGYGNTYNSIVWGNTRAGLTDNYFLSTSGWEISYSCTTPLPGGSGNIASDPAFQDSSAGDYRLQTNSPCVNVGNNAYVQGDTDYLGHPRIQDATVDMGAIECTPANTKRAQALSFPQLPGRVYGDAPFTLSATATSGLAVQYTSITPTVIAILSNGTVRILSAGTATVAAQQPGDAAYEAAAPVTNTFLVSKATLTITALDQFKPYGAAFAFSGNEFTASGLQNADAVSSVTLASSGAAADASVGAHPVAPSDALGSGLSNYAITYANGTFQVGVPAVTFTPPDGTRFTNFVRVTLSTVLPGAPLRYTLDGSSPGEESALYTNALIITSTASIRARAFFELAEPGPVTEATFTRLYGLSVAGGTAAAGAASGFYPAGTNLALTAAPPPEGCLFGWWSVSPASADLGAGFAPSQSATSMTMPAQTLALTAVYVPAPAGAPGFVDVHLTDAASGLPVDAAQWSPGSGAWYPQGLCPLAPRHYTIRFRSSDPHWIAPEPSRFQVAAGVTQTVAAAFLHVPIVSAAAEGDGSVYLKPATGQVMPGKSVTLKAKARNGSVFVQWSDGERSASREVAPDVDTLYTALFAPVDQPCYQESLLTLRLEGADAGTVGVTFPFSQVTPACLPATFDAEGLPPGLSLNRNTGVISGRPTKAGTYAASFTAAGPAGGKGALSRTFTVATLPADVQGTFSGILCESDSVRGVLSLNVSPSGAVSAKATTRTSVYSFAARGWDAENNGTFSLSLHAPQGASLTLTFDRNLGPWQMNLNGRLAADGEAASLTVVGQRSAFKARPLTDDAAAVLASYRSYYTAALPPARSTENKDDESLPQGSGFLTLDVRPDGRVWCSGRTADGQPLSGSTELFVCEAGAPGECAYIPLFFPLSGKRGLLAGLLALEPNDSAAPNDNTLAPAESHPLRWTRPASGAAATLRLDASGGFYDTETDPSPDYVRAWFEAQRDSSPLALGKGKKAFAASDLIESLLPNLMLQLDSKSGSLRLPDGARPLWDQAAGEYIFDPANPACATLSLNARTGRFTGQFNVYYAGDDGAAPTQVHTLRISHEGVLTPVRRAPESTPSGQGFYLLPETMKPSEPPRILTRQRSFLVEIQPPAE